jgi:hypothetical protein
MFDSGASFIVQKDPATTMPTNHHTRKESIQKTALEV